MIVSCPACTARFRLDRQRISGKRITLRCVRCREIFKIEAAVSSSAPRLKVMVAHADPALCDTVHDILAREGIACTFCHDGEIALQQMEASPPAVAIIDVGLPGRFIFELIEDIRRRPALNNTRLILLSAVYNKAAYKRRPSSLYGADDYIEKHHLPDDLIPKINSLVGKAEKVPSRTSSTEELVPGQHLEAAESGSLNDLCQEVNPRIRQAEEQETACAPPEERIHRIAHMIAADIALYNQDRLERGIANGDLFQTLAAEIAEGERILSERVSGLPNRNLVAQALAELVAGRHGEAKQKAGKG